MKKTAIAILLITIATFGYNTVSKSVAATVVPTELPKELDLETRHQLSGLNSSFPEQVQSFEQYVDHYRKVISEARTDLAEKNREWVIEGNMPFQLQPATHCDQQRAGKYRRGVVFTHGLTDSVYQIRHLAKYFQQQCFYVMAVLLPGHGTRPGDMLEVSWKDWVKATDFAVDQMAARVNDVYLAGYSTGGTLALLKASNDKRVKGVFAFSPAVKISSFAGFAGFIGLLDELFDSMKWLNVMKDEDYFKYESFPYNAVSQIHQLTRMTRKSIAENGIDTPVFIVTSAQDATIEVEHTIDLMKKLKHEKNYLLLYSQYQRSEPEPIRVVNSHFPAKHQLSLAHTGLSIPAHDPHYGKNGSYRNCSHYYDKGNEDYIHCKYDEEIFVGEITKENLQQGIMARATYNFLYPEMLAELSNFIKNL
jgi:esterase/lipase